MNDTDPLQGIRAQIDQLDSRILSLLNDRARLAQEIARVKATVEQDDCCYRPEREAAVLREIQARNQGPLDDAEVARLFREIMSACLALEQTLNIAFLGPEGTFTQQAVFKHFGHSVDVTSLGAIDEVFREVESGSSRYGVVPVENSTEGVINHTLDMFMHSPLRICGEVELRIHHHLVGKVASLGGVARVLSHQQSLAQCREWLDRNLPNAAREPVSSNAEAARLAGQSGDSAAIAGEAAAEIYGLKTLAKNIEDEPDNTTRFLVIGNKPVAPSGADKTSLLVSARNRAGALGSLIAPFAANGINMTRIESRPARSGLWQYVFFVDIEGHEQDDQVAKALQALEQEAAAVKVLGSYPKAVL